MTTYRLPQAAREKLRTAIVDAKWHGMNRTDVETIVDDLVEGARAAYGNDYAKAARRAIRRNIAAVYGKDA